MGTRGEQSLPGSQAFVACPKDTDGGCRHARVTVLDDEEVD